MSNIQVLRAENSHKNHVLKLLDDFRTCCMDIIAPEKKFISTTATEKGGSVFDVIIDSPNSAIFLAHDDGTYIGIATIHKIPQIRKGRYCAEIEEMFVEPTYQGKGVAMPLIDAMVNWARENDIKSIRLESSNELTRAHGFYEKAGFKFYGRAYEKTIE